MNSDKIDRKNSIGVAFSGGGLQGIAHIGAVQALYELGIHPQYVSGTSSGAAMAAIVAMGCDSDEMKRVAKKHWKTLAEIDNGLIFKSLAQLILNKKIQKDGIKSGELIEDVIRDIMNEKGITGFENLPINLSICTVDTLTTDECIFTTKEENLENEHIHYITGAPLETAVRASMSFPAIYTTCPYDKYNFIDGGSKDNLPVKILRDMGVGKVLAIGFDIMTYNPDAGLGGLIKVGVRLMFIQLTAQESQRKWLTSQLISRTKTHSFSQWTALTKPFRRATMRLWLTRTKF